MTVKAIPAGQRTASPYLAIKNAARALEFYKKAFGATEIHKLMIPDGHLGHAEIRLGDSVIMMADEFPEYGGKAPETLGGSPVSIHLYVEDVDALFKKAVAAGAKERKPVMDQFYDCLTSRQRIAVAQGIPGGFEEAVRRGRQLTNLGNESKSKIIVLNGHCHSLHHWTKQTTQP